jgi:hypothetical protein
MTSPFDQFQSPAPVDVAGTPFQDEPSALSKLIFGQQEGPDVRDPQRMAPARYIATASPRTKRAREILGSEPMQRLMMLSQFIGAGPKPLLNPATGKFPKGADPIKRGFRERPPEFPGIYRDPREIAADAAKLTAPEDPSMKRLFGTTRDDLFGIAEGGKRQGNVPGEEFVKWAPNARGSKSAEGVMTDKNAQRVLDVLAETEKAAPELTKGMKSWYTMDPAYKRLVELVGPEAAKMHYERLNTFTGMSSPGSEVMTELNRGTAANWLASEGRFNDFVKYGGRPSANGAPINGAPADMAAILGHPYHKTSQALPMSQYLETGKPQLGAPKVASYIPASGVPETGFQTNVPVGDAHFSRAMGLADTRKGPTDIGASISTPELQAMLPWFREKIAGQFGAEPVPTQATMWGAFAPQTGVTTPIGAPKLELLSRQIMKAAERMGVSPEVARDMILTGKAHAGEFAGPAIGAGTLGAATGAFTSGGEQGYD